MGCSGSKDTVETVKTTAQSDQFQAAVTKVQLAISGPEPTETELAQQELRERIEANDKRRLALETTRTTDDDGGGTDHHNAKNETSDTYQEAKSKKGKKQISDNNNAQHSANDATPLQTPPLSPSASRRGYVDAQQKDNVKSHYAATVGGSAAGGINVSSPRAASSAPSASARDQEDDETLDKIDAECDCGDDEALLLLKDMIVRARRERDGAVAELKRVAAERDASREEYAYLRATADISDNFENTVRIPPNWAASEQKLIEELRQRNAGLESELTVVRHQLRRRRFMSTDKPALVQLLSTSSSAAGGGSPTTMQTPGLLMSSSSSAFGAGADRSPLFHPTVGAPLPLSPTELASSVRSLQARYVSAEQEVHRVESFHRQAHANAQQEAAALHQQSLGLRQSIAQLEQQHREYSERSTSLADMVRAAEDLLKKKQAEVAAAADATTKEALTAEIIKSDAAAAIARAADMIAQAEVATALAAEATAQVAAEQATLTQRREQQEQIESVACAEKQQQQQKEQSDSQFLRQVSRLLINAEHCPDDVRLQLLQFVCEHGGLPIEGRGTSRLVADPTEFDMNGILYGDAIAYLASLVISRPACRIESLVLSETAMTDLGCAQIALTLAVLPFETTLRCMNLSNNELTARGVTQLLTALQSSALCAGIGGRPTIITQRLTVDLDNNPELFRTVEDVQLVTSLVEAMKKSVPLVEVLLPRLPKLDQLVGKTAQGLRSSSVFVPPPLGT
jgi:hypothetical protein